MSTFDSLFLAGKGDALPAIDALALFYDFRELTPIGRRGDEMIRRLADRLVSVDLLYQAERAAAAPDRPPAAGRRARAGRLAAGGDLHDGPQARRRRWRRCARPASPTSTTTCATSACCLKRGRFPTSAVTTSPTRWSPISRAARRSGCAPTSCGRRRNGRRRRSSSSCCTAIAGRSSRRSPTPSAPTSCAPRSAMRWARTRSASRGSASAISSKMGEGPDARAFEVVTAPIEATGTEFTDDRPLDRGGRHAGGVPARPARALSGDRRDAVRRSSARPSRRRAAGASTDRGLATARAWAAAPPAIVHDQNDGEPCVMPHGRAPVRRRLPTMHIHAIAVRGKDLDGASDVARDSWRKLFIALAIGAAAVADRAARRTAGATGTAPSRSIRPGPRAAATISIPGCSRAISAGICRAIRPWWSRTCRAPAAWCSPTICRPARRATAPNSPRLSTARRSRRCSRMRGSISIRRSSAGSAAWSSSRRSPRSGTRCRSIRPTTSW